MFGCSFEYTVMIYSSLFQGVKLAQKFEALVKSDDRFEIPAKRHLGMVVFRLKGDNSFTEQLLKKLNSSGIKTWGFFSSICKCP